MTERGKGDHGRAGHSLATRSLSDDSPSSGDSPVAEHEFPIVPRSHYDIGEEFARGGSGRLLRARDRRLDRVVAIKEPTELSTRVQERFRREALLTARLQHPSIVPVHEIGRWPSGEPFYAMKLISGRSLRDVVAEATTLARRVALVPNVLAVADAIAYAHAERVIHRDLKPSNVMVGAFGETQVIDWGLAKALSDPEDVESDLSIRAAHQALHTGVVGTPSSMAPEQAAGRPPDERTDVYGVGAILYHVLAGAPPYVGDDSAGVLEALLRGPPPPIGVRAPGAPRELVAIVERAMAREPADRYPSARELAADLRRFLAGQLVAAHAYSWSQLTWRFMRRNRLVLGVLASSLAALAVFGEYSVRRILVERGNALTARAQAETQRSRLLLSQAKLWMDRDPTVGLAWLKEYAGTQGADGAAISTLAADARARGVASQRVRDRKCGTLAPDGVTLAAQQGSSVVVWTTTNATPRALGAVKTAVGALAFSADSRTLFVADGDVVRSFGLDGGAPRELLHADQRINQLVPAGALILAGGARGTMWLLDPASPDTPPRPLLGNPDGTWTQHASRDGRELLSSSRNLVLPVHLRLWHLPGGESESLPGVPVWPALSGDGSLVAWGGADGVVHVYDVGKRTTRDLHGHHGGIRQVTFSTDGTKVASTSEDGSVRVWDLAGGSSRVFEVSADWTMLVEFSPDGRLLAATSLDRTVRVWDLVTDDRQTLLGHLNAIDTIGFTPDSKALVTADDRGEVRVWPVLRSSDRVLTPGGPIPFLRFLPDGRLLAGDEQGIEVWDPATSAATTIHDPGSNEVIAISRDGSTVAQGRGDGVLRVRDLASGTSRSFAGHEGTIRDLALTRDGGMVVTCGDDRSVRLWNMRSGEGRILGKHAAAVWHVAFSPDERTVVSAADEMTLRLWDVDGAQSRALVGHTGLVFDLAFSPDGRWIASAGLDTTVRLWPAAGGAARVFEGHEGLVHQLAFSPNGRTLATASDDRTVRLWDVSSGSAVVLQHGAAVTVVRFAADGQSVVSGTTDGVVRVWDLIGGLRAILRGRPAEIVNIAIAQDSRSVAVAGYDGAVRLWDGISAAPRAAGTPADLAEISSVGIVGEEALSR